MKKLNFTFVALGILLLIIAPVYYIYIKYESKHIENEKFLINKIAKMPNIDVDTCFTDLKKALESSNIDVNKTIPIIKNELKKSKLDNLTKHYVNESYIQHQIDRNLLSRIGNFIPILLALFTGVFTYFAFITQMHVNRAEKYSTEVNQLKKDVDESISKSLENLDLSSKEFDKKIELIFVILNDFLKDDYKVDANILPEILDLWNSERTNYAALKIRAFDTKGQALPYVSKRISELGAIKEPDDKTLAIIRNLQETKDHLETIINS